MEHNILDLTQDYANVPLTVIAGKLYGLSICQCLLWVARIAWNCFRVSVHRLEWVVRFWRPCSIRRLLNLVTHELFKITITVALYGFHAQETERRLELPSCSAYILSKPSRDWLTVTYQTSSLLLPLRKRPQGRSLSFLASTQILCLAKRQNNDSLADDENII